MQDNQKALTTQNMTKVSFQYCSLELNVDRENQPDVN